MTTSFPPLGELPAELGTAIVQLAACADVRDALSLVLVSSAFRAVANPALYGTVRVTPRNWWSLRDSVLDASTRNNFASFTQHIIVHSAMGPGIPSDIAFLFSGEHVESVCCTPPVASSLSKLRLGARLRIQIVSGLYNLNEATAHAFDCTHLYISRCLLPLTPPATSCNFENMCRLTHIVLRPWIPRPRAVDLIRSFVAMLRALITACPNLQRLIVRIGDPALETMENNVLLYHELEALQTDDRVYPHIVVDTKEFDPAFNVEELTCRDVFWEN
ncbi:hypothetical protein EXIGLDRAFT_840556 [Exidia glandulosa HHB12029]|uniref:F-box domain-containing protein n=1 Tax=Exidia glandulosa HHB12029 TaxID=1314781 RepID=A0A165EDG0_EXIGL|nr:hypothetical protein EXIGLDRAFT_840556 [Exidia glandulosa HHB12029]